MMSLFLLLLVRLATKSLEVVLAKAGGRREMEVGKMDDRSSCKQRLSIKLQHCSNFLCTLEKGRREVGGGGGRG